MNRVKSFSLLFILLISGCLHAQNQSLLNMAIEYTNVVPGNSGRGVMYQKFSCPGSYLNLLFAPNDTALLIIKPADAPAQKTTIKKSDFGYNRRSALFEYYLPIGNLDSLKKIGPFRLVISSADMNNAADEQITAGDLKSMIEKLQSIQPQTNKGAKNDLKHFKETGDSRGQLMGAETDISIKKRTKCSTKKQAYRKDGINGIKAMTAGF